jgi:hypothetical protein
VATRKDQQKNDMKRPPYSSRLSAILADPDDWQHLSGTSANGEHLTVWVLAGSGAWDAAHDWLADPPVSAPWVLAPPGADPAALDWSALAAHPPVLLMPCGELRQAEEAALASAILRDGGESVMTWPMGRGYTAMDRRT